MSWLRSDPDLLREMVAFAVIFAIILVLVFFFLQFLRFIPFDALPDNGSRAWTDSASA